MQNKKNLLGCSLESLEVFFQDIGESKYRAKQVIKWIHQKGVIDFYKMTNLNKKLIEKLNTIAFIKPPTIEEQFISDEGTKKYLIKLHSGSMIEMVVIPEGKRRTLCVSSQAGCALQCTFCATGAQGFDQNLESDEIIGQLWLANFSEKSKKPITNVVFMGMGEPLLNFDAVIEATKIIKDQNAYGLSRKRITISTSGIVPNIKKLNKHVDVSLAISLHAANDDLRDKIVPINKKYPIKMLLSSCIDFLADHDNKRHITIEYILIKDINDSYEDAKSLVSLLSTFPCKINLIPFNKFEGSDYERPSNNRINNFKKYLIEKGFITTLRTTRGDAVDAACGQLVGNLSKSLRGKKLISHKSLR